MTDDLTDIVRERDKDRFLATLFAPEQKQKPLFALFAFKCEIERIPLLVSEPQVGEIRFRWWIDALNSIARNEKQDHPVATALADVANQYTLPVQSMVRLVEAHQFDLYADQMPSRNDLEGYLGETESILFQLGSMILDQSAAKDIATVSGLAGVAFGLARLLNRNEPGSKFIPAVENRYSLMDLARQRLAELRALKPPRNLLPVILPVALAETYLAAGHNSVPQWKRQWTLWRAARKEMF